MTGLTILLAAATLGFALAQWLRLPVIPLLLAAGVIIGEAMPQGTAEPEVVDSQKAASSSQAADTSSAEDQKPSAVLNSPPVTTEWLPDARLSEPDTTTA